MKNFFALFALVSLLTGCGPGFQAATPTLSNEPPVGIPTPDGLVIRSRTVYFITTENGQTVTKRILNFVIPTAFAANPTAVPITVVNAPNASMTVNSAALVAPAVITDTTSLGNLKITALKDNQLKVCGTGNQKCGTAIIRMYTTGTTGAGLYNSADGYGAPISAGLGLVRAVVGLTSSNAANVQTYTIPSNKNVIRDTDFATQPMQYNVDVDFSNAGSGTYSTTLVVEYGLAL